MRILSNNNKKKYGSINRKVVVPPKEDAKYWVKDPETGTMKLATRYRKGYNYKRDYRTLAEEQKKKRNLKRAKAITPSAAKTVSATSILADMNYSEIQDYGYDKSIDIDERLNNLIEACANVDKENWSRRQDYADTISDLFSVYPIKKWEDSSKIRKFLKKVMDNDIELNTNGLIYAMAKTGDGEFVEEITSMCIEEHITKVAFGALLTYQTGEWEAREWLEKVLVEWTKPPAPIRLDFTDIINKANKDGIGKEMDGAIHCDDYQHVMEIYKMILENEDSDKIKRKYFKAMREGLEVILSEPYIEYGSGDAAEVIEVMVKDEEAMRYLPILYGNVLSHHSGYFSDAIRGIQQQYRDKISSLSKDELRKELKRLDVLVEKANKENEVKWQELEKNKKKSYHFEDWETRHKQLLLAGETDAMHWKRSEILKKLDYDTSQIQEYIGHSRWKW